MSARTLFQEITAGHRFIPGWGFPPFGVVGPENPAAEAMREALLPFADNESLAQLIRWYWGVVRSRPAVAAGFGAAGSYDVAVAWRPSIEVLGEEFALTPADATGLLQLGWRPKFDSGGLVARLENITPESCDLVFPLVEFRLQLSEGSRGYDVTWPPEMEVQCSFSRLPTRPAVIVFRPHGFDAKAIIARVEEVTGQFGYAGLERYWATADDPAKIGLSFAILRNYRG